MEIVRQATEISLTMADWICYSLASPGLLTALLC